MSPDYRIDEIDKRILYLLTANARDTSAPMIADRVDVTPATIRNRIKQLEEHGIIQGYHADLAYDRTDGRRTTQITCTAPVDDRQRMAREALQVSGVVGVRELLAGTENLLFTVVGTDTDDVSRITRELAELGLSVEREDTIHNDVTQPYQPFAPEEGTGSASLTDFRSLSGGAEVVEFLVGDAARIAGHTVEAASEAGLLDGALVVSIERGDRMLAPKGDTEITAGDVVTLFSRDSVSEETVRAFEADSREQVDQ